jgi:hypothetical protein
MSNEALVPAVGQAPPSAGRAHLRHHTALNKLAKMNRPEPTFKLISSVCPHLNEEEVREILSGVSQGETVRFAAPPLRVNGAFQIIRAYAAYQSSSGQRTPAYLEYGQAGRLKGYEWESPSSDESRIKYEPPFPEFAERAYEYAKENWGAELVDDTWVDFVTVLLEDPKDLTRFGFPSDKMLFRFTTDRPWNDIANDRKAPKSTLIDESIVQVTTSPFISAELKGGRVSYTSRNCWRCGDGLGLSECDGCHARFTDDQYRSGPAAPLSQKLVEHVLATGHQFDTDPTEAQEEERTRWAVRQAARPVHLPTIHHYPHE